MLASSMVERKRPKAAIRQGSPLDKYHQQCHIIYNMAYQNEAGVSDFLMTTWANYAPGGEALDEEVPQADGSLVGTTVDGSWKMVDTYHVNATRTRFNGREVVFKDDEPIWAANYHSVIPDESQSEAVLGFFYGHVAANPDPHFPVSAIQGTQDERFIFSRRKLMSGELTVARFAIGEAIQDRSKSDTVVFNNLVIGGWIS